MTEQKPPEDRRESHRIPLDIDVRVGEEAWKTSRGNIAIGGLYFEKPLSLPIGAVVQLRFDLPGLDKRIETRAEVVEVTSAGKPNELGTRVKFIGLDLRTELLIARFLDRYTLS